MQKVTLVSLSIEGFGSYAIPTKFKFNSQGLFCITGRNGAGKSTIFSALYWVLYKKTLGGWSNENLQTLKRLRPKEYKGTKVSVAFVAGKYKFLAVRHLNYKGLTYGVEGLDSFMLFRKPKTDKTPFAASDMVGDELYKKDQQVYLNKVLGIDHNTFINSIVFGQKMNRLIGADPKEKRELFETLFELDFIDSAKEKADLKKAELEKELSELLNQVEKIKATLIHKQDQLAGNQKILADFTVNKKERLAEIKKEHLISVSKYNLLVDQLNDIEEAESLKKELGKGKAKVNVDALADAADKARIKLEGIRQKLHTNNLSLGSTDRSIQDMEAAIVKLSSEYQNVKDTCPTCNGKLKPENVKAAKANIETAKEAKKKELLNMQWHRGDLVKGIAALKEQETEGKAEFDEAYAVWDKAKDAERKSIDPNVTKKASIKSQMEIIDEGTEAIKARYAKEKARPLPEVDIEGIEASIGEQEKKIAAIQPKIDEINEELSRVIWWIKKGFGASGVKSHIFSAMLQKLNEYAAKYSVYFGYGVRFWVDLSKASKPFMTTVYSGDNDETPYGNLSGGQKQRVDVCLAFAMYDLVSYKTKFNIMVLDETSESLDEEGVAMVNEIITQAAEEKAVYIVSHNPIFVPPSASTIMITGGVKEPSSITV